MRPIPSLLALSLLLAPAASMAAPDAAIPLTIEQVMADPDWIGPPVESAWWAWNGAELQYPLKRAGSPLRDVYRQPVDGAAAQPVADAARATLDAPNPVYDARHARMAFVRDGNVFVRDLRSGALSQLSRSNAAASRPQFAVDGGLIWRVGNDWYHWNAATGTVQAAMPKAERDPAAPPKADTLRDHQLSVLATLQRDREQKEALREQAEALRRADATRAPAPLYFGNDVDIVDSALSPDGRHLLVVTQAKGADEGKSAPLPRYVTESGYVETQEARTLVGRNEPLAQALWLADATTGKVRPLAFDGLPGIADDPLAALRKAAGQSALKGLRAVRIETDGDGMGPAIHWSADGRQAAVLLRAVDNKDRWIATVDADGNAGLQPRHRLTDPGWINWSFNDFGWLPDNRTLWLLSEQSGWSQLYTVGTDGKAKLRSGGGHWEVSQPQLAADGKAFLFLCNREQPIRYELCRLDLGTDKVSELTSLQGVEEFSPSPDGRRLLVRYSSAYLPAQLAVLPAEGGNAVKLTDTRTAAYKARTWVQPQFVQVPSRHGAGSVWAKYYGPAHPEPGKKYPIVMFVHGAGYLQNVDTYYPAYFREQMFHNLLVQQGYIVLDMDYRGSAGYGRDWRTAIYRDMGHPELDDYLDGLDWLVADKQGDRERAGIYGGSYGGFMTYMALFRAPGTFKAGAALRPVADWMHYNHEYTSNILNTPDIDPEAYKRSSPIEYADGLRDRLLIAHGMIDDNVFFQDSVDMTQKLIELHKDGWEIAPYPLERHGFVRPDSWLDEYKRVLKLFDETLKPAP